MDLDHVVTLVKNDKNDEIKTLLESVSAKEKCDLLSAALNNAIENFAQILEVLLDNTVPSIRFQIMKYSLTIINSSDVPETHLLSILRVLYIGLIYVPHSALTSMAEFLLSQICDGTGKNHLWTELLPRVMQIIVKNESKYFVTPDNITFIGHNYRKKFVEDLIKSSEKWKPQVIPEIASMLKQGIPLVEGERFAIFEKLCNSMDKLDPSSLSTFAYHLFQASLHPKLFVGVLLALDKYFRPYYFKKIQPSDLPEPTQNSMMASIPVQCFRKEEDIIITQIYYEMEHNFPEDSLSFALKEITLTPELLLSPFMFESLIGMMHQTPNISSLLTKTIHTAIKNNYIQIEILKSSFYVKAMMEEFPKSLDIESIIDQIIRDSVSGLEVITAGLFSLAYSFLRNEKNNPKLHNLTAVFLVNFLLRRPIYTRGVFEKLLSIIIGNTKAEQYKECLEKVITSKNLVLQQVDFQKPLEEAFDDIPSISSESAMNLMTIVLPLLRKSTGTSIRNSCVTMLQRAISNSCVSRRQMAVFGCGLLLKQMKYSEVTANVNFHNLTGAYITGYSFRNQMSQMDINNLSPHDMMTLEIMGVLSKAFCLDYEVKRIMYKGLRKAAMANIKVLPHIIDFLIPHFRNFIENSGSNIVLKFESIVEDNFEKIVVKDNFGALSELLIHCVVQADLKNVAIENVFLRDLFENSMDKVLQITLNHLDVTTPFTEKKCILGIQFLNFLESLMAFGIWKTTCSNGFIMKINKLSDHYHLCYDELKKLANPKTGTKRKKETWSRTIQNMESVWDLSTLLRFLEIYYDVNFWGLTEDLVLHLKSKGQLKTKVLKATTDYIRNIRSEPSYMQIKFSTKSFEELCQCAKIGFDRLFKSDYELCSEETLMVFEMFKECIITATTTFKRKFEKFVSKLPDDGDDEFEKNVFRIISQLTAMILKLCESTHENEFQDKSYETKLLNINISVVEMFLPYMDAGRPFCSHVYQVFFALCAEYEMNSRSLAIALKVLLALRQKCKPLGDFYINIAALLTQEFGFIKEPAANISHKFELKAITKVTLEPAADNFLMTFRAILDQNTFLLKKANALIYRLIKIPGQKKYSEQILFQVKEIEKMTINLLIVVCKSMQILSNAKIPLGKLTDNYFRVLIHLYSNGEKLAKIFKNHNAAVEDQIDFFGLRELCIASHDLTRPVASFILYMQNLNTIAASSYKLTGSQASKMVRRDGRLIPKYVLWFENFSVEIHNLCNKTKQTFHTLLHLGVYRDFKIKTDELRNALNKKRTPLVIESQSSSDAFEAIEDKSDSESCDEEEKFTDDESVDTENKGTNKRTRIRE